MKGDSAMPNRAAVESRKRLNPPGTRVELVSMEDPFDSKLKPGDKGTVFAIDGIGTVFVDWDSGSSLGAALSADRIKKI